MWLRLECLKSALVTVAQGAMRAAGAREQWREVPCSKRGSFSAGGGKHGGVMNEVRALELGTLKEGAASGCNNEKK
jgi:hypothetical protein